MMPPPPPRVARTLGFRVAVWYATVFFITVSLVGVLAYWLLASSLVSRDHDLLHVKLAEYAGRYETGGLRALSAAVAAEQASGGPDAVLVRVLGPRADVLLVSGPPAWSNLDPSGSGQLRPGTDEVLQQAPEPSSSATLEVASRVLGDGTILQVGRTTVSRERFLRQVRDLFGILIIAVLIAGLAGGSAVTQSALGPLRALRDTVRGITNTGRLDMRVAADAHADLVGELGTLFNAMLARIEMLVGGMRHALDNVAHDLRTPVARLRARAEAALATAETPEAYRDALAACVEEADAVIALLTTLMDISEAETGTMHLARESVPVADLVRETVDLYEDAAEDKGVALTTEVEAGLTINADRQRMRQVLANLVDNAVKYTPAGGHVTIRASREGASAAIAVADTGPGIAPADLPRIWERLYRAQDQTSSRGLGLGLSLVRAIVTAHGGQTDVASEVGRGSTFFVKLPVEAPPA